MRGRPGPLIERDHLLSCIQVFRGPFKIISRLVSLPHASYIDSWYHQYIAPSATTACGGGREALPCVLNTGCIREQGEREV